MSGAAPEQSQQRIDQWLWHARFFKTRTLAAKFVNDGNVRVTRSEETNRVSKASVNIVPGDVLTFSRSDHLRVIEISDLSSRRGPAAEAQALYTDHSPPRPPKPARTPAPFEREKGAGRPTKKERRSLDALKL